MAENQPPKKSRKERKQDAIRKNGAPLSGTQFSVQMQSTLQRLNKLHKDLSQKLQRDPTYTEVENKRLADEIDVPFQNFYKTNSRGVIRNMLTALADKLALKNGVKFKGASALQKIHVLENMLIDDPTLQETAYHELTTDPYAQSMAASFSQPTYYFVRQNLMNWLRSHASSPYQNTTGFNPSVGSVIHVDSHQLAQSLEKPQTTLIGPENQYHYNAINSRYIASFIAPMSYTERKPCLQPVRTAIATGAMQFSVSSNGSGNLGIYVFPKDVLGQGIRGQEFVQILNDATFDPVAGTQGVAGINKPGPLYNSTVAIEQFKMSTLQVEFLPTVSNLNQSGVIQWIYWQRPINATLVGNVNDPVINQDSMPNQPYYQTAPINKNLICRSIRLPCDTDNLIFNDGLPLNDPYQEGFYILLTGCPPSTQIGQVVISFTYEFIPQQSYAVICAAQLPCPGIATQAAVSNLLTQFPSIWHLPEDQANKLANKIYAQAPTSHDDLMALIRSQLDQQAGTSTRNRYLTVDDRENNMLLGSLNSSYVVD